MGTFGTGIKTIGRKFSIPLAAQNGEVPVYQCKLLSNYCPKPLDEVYSHHCVRAGTIEKEWGSREQFDTSIP
jgi:hypothetical protein